MSSSPHTELRHSDGTVQVIPNVYRHAAARIARDRLRLPVEGWEAAHTFADQAGDIPRIEAELARIVAEIKKDTDVQ